ncbi:MAG: hypothetical protein AAFV43_17400, partial [Planctomycetota bacterium]
RPHQGAPSVAPIAARLDAAAARRASAIVLAAPSARFRAFGLAPQLVDLRAGGLERTRPASRLTLDLGGLQFTLDLGPRATEHLARAAGAIGAEDLLADPPLAAIAAEAAAGDAAEAAEEAVETVTAAAAGDVDLSNYRTASAESIAAYEALTGDAAAGRRVFTKCMACHVVQEGQ